MKHCRLRSLCHELLLPIRAQRCYSSGDVREELPRSEISSPIHKISNGGEDRRERGPELEPQRRTGLRSSERLNQFGIQMISEELFQALFQGRQKNVSRGLVAELTEKLRESGLFLGPGKTVPDPQLSLPRLAGGSLDEHFQRIGEEMSAPYRHLLHQLARGIPPAPTHWSFQPGWVRYTDQGNERVDHPLEDALVLDVEVCLEAGQLPTLATAVSPHAWYSWLSSDLFQTDPLVRKQTNSLSDLIPLESGPRRKGFDLPHSLTKPRITVGHNVSFDRSKVKEQYWLEQTGMRFLDTMSLHICVSGVTSYQKALLKAGLGEEEWSQLSSLSSLTKVHKLYCGKEIDKSTRDLFLTGSLVDIRNNFQEAVTYCAADVMATFNIFKKLYPLFLERFPHPVTLAGMLEIQTAYLPVNKNWYRYLSDSQSVFEDLDFEAKSLMYQCASKSCELLHNEDYKSDLWLWDQNWTCKSLKLKKDVSKDVDLSTSKDVDLSVMCEKSQETEDTIACFPVDSDCYIEEKLNLLTERFQTIISKARLIPVRVQHLMGYPEWFRKLCEPPSPENWLPEPTLVGTGLKIAPKLLRLTWKSLPLHCEKNSGWGYIVPYKTTIQIEKQDLLPMEELKKYFLKVHKNELCSCPSSEESQFQCKGKKKRSKKICKDSLGVTFGLIKLPHKDGPSNNVGNPLARDFINKFSENTLSSDSTWAKKILEINRMLSYWRNNHERIESQFVCWLKPTDIPTEMGDCLLDIGAILPTVVVSGTLTRRAVEPTWMTASNASGERVGSELRGLVQAPPGYSLVGADVDSQELWIASLLGDAAAARLHGATPLAWMTLNGQKADATDMHSVTARAVGISRGDAKVLNYARIYGAGERFAQRLLKQFNPDMAPGDAALKAQKMMELTKGKRMFKLQNDIVPHISERQYTKEEAVELCKQHNKPVEEMFEKAEWVGGTESAMFNALEKIANEGEPRTPFLGCRLSRALEPRVDNSDRHLPTRVNWVVQSGAVDFLHLMLASMRWFLGRAPRFCLSFHDEVRYLVKDDLRYQAALALHVTNLLVRSFCVSRLGMSDLPLSVAFFSSVEVDKVLRKESKDDNKTPSNPFGLSKAYGIPIGESLDIYQAIQKSGGQVGIKPMKENNAFRKRVKC